MAQSPSELIVRHLHDAHALESHLVSTLSAHIAMTPRGEYRRALEAHRQVTADQADAIRGRLRALGEHRNPFDLAFGLWKDALGQFVALAKGPVDLLRAASSGEEKLFRNAKDEAASEALEIATYDGLEALARGVGDVETAELARRHREQEEEMLARLRALIPVLAEDVMQAEVGGLGTYDVTETGAADAVRRAGREARSAAGRTGEAVGEAVGDTVDQAGDRVEDAATATGDVVQAAASTAGSAVDEAAEAAAEAVTPDAPTAEDLERVDAAAEAVAEAPEALGGALPAAGETSEARPAGETGEAQPGAGETAPSAPAAPDATGDPATGLPIAGYDRLGAPQVVARLHRLAQVDLARVDAYERANANRRSVLDRIAALRGPEPFTGYDQATVPEIRRRLAAGDAALVQAVRDYERVHKQRQGVLDAATRSLAAAGR
jgi:ferritin-like metal-binding protein YciE